MKFCFCFCCFVLHIDDHLENINCFLSQQSGSLIVLWGSERSAVSLSRHRHNNARVISSHEFTLTAYTSTIPLVSLYLGFLLSWHGTTTMKAGAWPPTFLSQFLP